jgi:hypothetical protein
MVWSRAPEEKEVWVLLAGCRHRPRVAQR